MTNQPVRRRTKYARREDAKRVRSPATSPCRGRSSEQSAGAIRRENRIKVRPSRQHTALRRTAVTRRIEAVPHMCPKLKLRRGHPEAAPSKPFQINDLDGRSDRIRTCDPLTPSQVRYQAAPRSEGAPYRRAPRPPQTQKPGFPASVKERRPDGPWPAPDRPAGRAAVRRRRAISRLPTAWRRFPATRPRRPAWTPPRREAA